MADSRAETGNIQNKPGASYCAKVKKVNTNLGAAGADSGGGGAARIVAYQKDMGTIPERASSGQNWNNVSKQKT